MISTFPPIFSSSDSILGNPFPSFDGGFTPWDCHELFPATPPLKPADDTSNSIGSGDTLVQSPKPIMSGSGSEDPNGNRSDYKLDQIGPNRAVSVVDERKRRRMISNRESARRSRMRKQKHLENLRNQVNRLRVENRELTNRLRFVLYHYQRVRTENGRLRSEHMALRQKLYDIRQILLFRQLQQFSSPATTTTTTTAWPCNTVISEQTPSLIT
ncbi:Basic-leucine zipper transcription factor [Parasponia andersonii]|uniref:Basic-leucine zipper transcription factor n=1 Tax=Parasponia andersonii TaxID=3476 RepID=A0A2P5AUV9_PARAD|nr:Basic-leucine zipper transcription factor [Parasponia andersonii]